jgi:hypothetical protein
MLQVHARVQGTSCGLLATQPPKFTGTRRHPQTRLLDNPTYKYRDCGGFPVEDTSIVLFPQMPTNQHEHRGHPFSSRRWLCQKQMLPPFLDRSLLPKVANAFDPRVAHPPDLLCHRALHQQMINGLLLLVA